jgi:hypothetical protein
MHMKPIVLALLIVVALAACGQTERASAPAAAPSVEQPVVATPPKPAPAYFRDYYAKLDDCVHDWGYAQKCTPVTPGSQVAAAGVAFMGPIYARSYREETQVQLRKEALEGGYAQQVANDASDRSIAKVEVSS